MRVRDRESAPLTLPAESSLNDPEVTVSLLSLGRYGRRLQQEGEDAADRAVQAQGQRNQRASPERAVGGARAASPVNVSDGGGVAGGGLRENQR